MRLRIRSRRWGLMAKLRLEWPMATATAGFRSQWKADAGSRALAIGLGTR